MDDSKPNPVIKLGARKAVSPEVTAFLKDVSDNSEVNPLSPTKVIIGSALVEVLPRPDEPSTVWLKDLMSTASGSGRAALKFIIALADRHDITISLCAKGYSHTPTVDLVVWYMSHGFEPEYDDFEVRLDDVEDGLDLIRHPNAESVELGSPVMRSPENTRLALNGLKKARYGIESRLAELVENTGVRIISELAPALYGYFVRKGSSSALREWTEVIAEAASGRSWRYMGDCTNSRNAPYLEDMMDAAVEVSYKTLAGAIGRESLMQRFPEYDWSSRPKNLTLANDYAVTYYKSQFRGHPCYYVRHSGIEHIWSAHDLDDGPKATVVRSNIFVDAHGKVSKNSRQSLFSVERNGDTASISQSSAATKASAFALRTWLIDNNITTVIENDEAASVQEFIAWLDLVLDTEKNFLTEGKVERLVSSAGTPFKIYINPTCDQMRTLCISANNDIKAVLVKEGPLLVWNAYYAHHGDALGAWIGCHHYDNEITPRISYRDRGNHKHLPTHYSYWLDEETVVADGNLALKMAKDSDLFSRIYPRGFNLSTSDYDSETIIVPPRRVAVNESKGHYLSPTSDNIEKAKSFVLRKWKERAAELGCEEPMDLSFACKFTSMFVQKVFGGELQGNYDHQFVLVDGEIVDLNVDAQDVKDLMDDGFDPHEHDRDFWGNDDHIDSLVSCQPRVDAWVREFWGTI